MAKLGVNEIRDVAKKIVKSSLGGIRFTQIIEKIIADYPGTSANTISGTIYDLDKQFPEEISKPSRGLYVSKEDEGKREEVKTEVEKKFNEQDFYSLFAEWIKTELDEATEAVEMGGASFKTKWGTPDVIGVYKPLASNLIKFTPEIISVEIKIDSTQPIVAFGQATAYRLFSHKSYVVMPSTMTEEDKSRLDSLCLLYGIGFIIFDLDLNNPNFSIRARAQRFEPDMFYVNEIAERLKQHDIKKFNVLFG